MSKSILHLLFLCLTVTVFGQKTASQALPIPQEGEPIRCYSTEYLVHQVKENSNQAVDTFEKWMSSSRKELTQQRAQKNNDPVLYTIPVIFHIIHRGESVGSGTNISAEKVYAQIDQLNYDFRKVAGTMGFSDHPDAADVQIEFCPALYDEAGNELAEAGIERINALLSFPPLGVGFYTGIVEFDDLVKRNTYWNPNDYLNIWSADLGPVLLGYAQFPEAPCLEGIGTGNGDAETDGVVCNYSSIGGEALGGTYIGRTATHEIGHWLGLRHIWGDTACGGDDFCEDTPNAADSNSGCTPNANSCDDSNNPYFNGTDPNDMVQNYMDYSNDACMNIFTNVQRDRMRIVMGELTGRNCEGGSPRRASLAASTKCTPINALVSTPTITAATANTKVNALRSTNLNIPTTSKPLVESIFPNPAVNEVTILLKETVKNVRVQVYNSVGQLVQESVVNNAPQVKLNTTQLESGIYFVSIPTTSGNLLHSLVIRK